MCGRRGGGGGGGVAAPRGSRSVSSIHSFSFFLPSQIGNVMGGYGGGGSGLLEVEDFCYSSYMYTPT